MVLAAPLGLALLLSGCSGDADPAAATPSSSVTAPADAATPVTTTSRIGKVTGKLSERHRDHLVARITAVVDAWWDAAYLGDYPRTDGFGDAFPGFTPGATSRAEDDLALMSNAAVGADVDAVSATARRLRVDVLAVDDRPVGVTARFHLGLRLSGDQDRDDSVVGTLFLSFEDGAWRVFGYDVTRGLA